MRAVFLDKAKTLSFIGHDKPAIRQGLSVLRASQAAIPRNETG